VANQNRRPASASPTSRQGTSSRGQRAPRQPVTTSRRTPGAGKAAGNKSAGSKVTGKTDRGTSAAPGPRRPEPAPGNATPAWLPIAALVLSVAGLGASIYLTIAHLTNAGILICSDKGLVNCAAVTTSPESNLFGVFPVAELGLAFFVLMVVINSPWAWRPTWAWLPKGWLSGSALRQRLPVLTWRVRLGSVIIGIIFVLYLIYTELVTLRAICLWCTSVHVVTFLLFVLLIVQATFWGPPVQPDPADRSSVKGASS
jgi:uncharacterized membrane protein